MKAVYFHGGVQGLYFGDRITPGHSRDNRHPGCQICEARAAGGSSIDPATSHPDRIYVTTDRGYARYYASLYGHGDLYVVEPAADLEPSQEDLFPSFTASSATVAAVLGRGITLTMRQREALYLRWGKLQGLSKNEARAEFKRMVGNLLLGVRP